MDDKHRLSNLVVGVGVIMTAFAIPHLIDDFLYQVPDEFGLTNPQAQFLAALFSAILIIIFSLAARGNRFGYFCTILLGAFLSLAAILKHIPKILMPEPYWGGLFSEVLIVGLLISSLCLVLVSVIALRNSKKYSRS